MTVFINSDYFTELIIDLLDIESNNWVDHDSNAEHRRLLWQLHRSNGHLKFWEINADRYEVELDKNIPAHGTPAYIKYLVLKAYLDVIRSYKLNTHLHFHPDLAENAAKLLESVRLDPKAICIYALASYSAGRGYFEHGQYRKAVELLLKSEKAIEDFKATGKSLPIEILASKFEVRNLFAPKHKKLEQIRVLVVKKLYESYENLKNRPQQAKYAIALIDIYLFAHSFELIRHIKSYIHALIDAHHYPQVNYILSSLILNLDKEKQTPSLYSENTKIKKTVFATIFVHWASSIIKYSLKAMRDPKICLNNPINEKVVSIRNIYEDDGGYTAVDKNMIADTKLPIQLMKDYDEIVACLEKGKAWVDRWNEKKRDSSYKQYIDDFLTLELTIYDAFQPNYSALVKFEALKLH